MDRASTYVGGASVCRHQPTTWCITANGEQRAIEDVSGDYPLIVDTGRQLEHYDTGTMTSRGLNYLRPEGEVEINPADAGHNGLKTGDWARLTTRHGSIEARVCVTDRVPPGMVFYPFHYPEQSANRLVGAEFDGASRPETRDLLQIWVESATPEEADDA